MEKFIAGSAAFAFGTMIYTINKKRKGELRPSIQKILANPTAASMDPKLAAYMFAGRAFMIGTGLTITGTVALVYGVAAFMGVNNLKDFSLAFKSSVQKTFPSLNASGPFTDEKNEELDEETLEFLREASMSIENESPVSPIHAIVGQDLKKSMGILGNK